LTGWRKRSRFGKQKQERIESLSRKVLEQRVRLQRLLCQENGSSLPVHGLPVTGLDDAEDAAENMSKRWHLGCAPIANLVDVLETHFVHVIELDSNRDFDGVSAVVRDKYGRVVAAGIVTRRGIPAERQRLSLAHELGHIVLKVDASVDKESAAFRFGGAFLAPREVLRSTVGCRRECITDEELKLLKNRFGMSRQALLHRMNDLEIITDRYYAWWCREINVRGWKHKEPDESAPELAWWLPQTVQRAFAEGLISRDDAKDLLGVQLDVKMPASLVARQALLALSVEERRRRLEKQAEKATPYTEEEYADCQEFEEDEPVE